LALLSASACMQIPDSLREGEMKLRWAVKWGCDKKLIGRVLISGVYNTLGKAAIMLEDQDRAEEFFASSISLIAPKNRTDLLVHARHVSEMSTMGLLPAAMKKTRDMIDSLRDKPESTTKREARIAVLEVEIAKLENMLALAQQRNQLSSSADNINNRNIHDLAVSQLGQDIWVIENSGFKKDGFFVEFGASDGILLSNTYLLEKEFGWKGICAEPNPKLHQKLKENRNCILSNDCIADENGKVVEFIMADVYGTISDYVDSDTHATKRRAYKDSGEIITLQTITLDRLLEKYDAPRDIDYISVDTEGSEYEILSVFPFDKWNVRMFTVEHNYSSQRENIFQLMKDNGYKRIENKWDDWFIKT